MPETVRITVASSGIGKELAIRFAAGGSNLVIVARSKTNSKSLHRRFLIASKIVATELTKPGRMAALVDILQSPGTEVDVLVNNARFGALGRFDPLSLERQMDIGAFEHGCVDGTNQAACDWHGAAATGMHSPRVVKGCLSSWPRTHKNRLWKGFGN